MVVNVELLEKTNFSLDDVLLLIKESFKERLAQGLNFTCSRISIEEFRRQLVDGKVLVAKNDSNELVGTCSLHIYTDDENFQYGYIEYVAVHPNCKRQGIGSLLLDECLDYLRNKGCSYVLSDTALAAKSSIKWHRRNGFVKIELKSYNSTDYYSILFRKSIVPCKKWDNRFYSTFKYLKSCVSKRLYYRKDGKKRTWFDWFVRKVKK